MLIEQPGASFFEGAAWERLAASQGTAGFRERARLTWTAAHALALHPACADLAVRLEAELVGCAKMVERVVESGSARSKPPDLSALQLEALYLMYALTFQAL